MTWSDLLPLLGVLIGGGLTLLGTVITDTRRAKREDEDRKREAVARERERLRETVIELLAKSADRRRELEAVRRQPGDSQFIAAAQKLLSEIEICYLSLLVSGHERISEIAENVLAAHRQLRPEDTRDLDPNGLSNVEWLEGELAQATNTYMLGAD